QLAVGTAGGTAGGPLGPFDRVVNALWEGRLAIDATRGIRPGRPFLFRRKLALHLRLPGPPLPTVTMVLGPYGDVVAFPGGHHYLSWYPTGCIARSTTLAPPPAFLAAPDAAAGARLTDEMVAALTRIIPGVAGRIAAAGAPRLEGGTIFTWGETDVDDPESELHQRFDVGVTAHPGGYLSIDTGKYTLAPLFAAEVAARVLA
ncbi:MAG: hypothetical protein AAFW69_07175, partial [Pseudomonadota bacterium]